MLKKTIVFGLLAIGALLYFIPEPEFSFSKVAKVSPHYWNVGPLSAEREKDIQEALSQKFSYLGCGAQSYVFFSEDGKSVLKLFKNKRFEAPLWVKLLPPLPYKVKKLQAKQDNLIKDFTSYQIAYNELRDETGLLLVHLDPTPLHYTVTIQDRLVHLGDYAFILQKRGELVYSSLEQDIKNGRLANAKQSISSLVRLLKQRCNKGVADRDPNFRKNYAFLAAEAIEIDIGRFSHTEVLTPKIPYDFKEWLGGLSPELLTHFEREYEEVFNRSSS